MARSRVSAAVCLVRGHGADRECFLVQRNPKLRFLGGFWAFAGGTLEEMDQAAARGKEDALLRCARRELFEETGVLSGFASSGTSSADAKLFELRQTLLDGHEAARTRAVRELEAALGDDGLALTRIARIETPPFVPRRYDTEFWLAQLPEEAEASIVSGELVDGRWLRPEDALSQWRAGELWIAPPVRFLIEELAAAADLESFVASARSKAAALEQGELHPVWFVPGLFMAPLATRTLPPATTTNCYIIGEQQLYVVDPASPEPSEQERLFAWLDARLAEGKRLEAVLLTHGHPDHTGAAAACCARYQVPLLAHPATLQQVPGQVSDSRALLGNERLSLGTSPDGKPGWELHVWHTPGHHPGHLCFVESRYGAALLGDLVSTISTIVIDPPEGHLRTYLDSLRWTRRRLLEFADAAGSSATGPGAGAETNMGFPSHGPPAPDAAAILADYVRHRRQREQRLLEAIHAGKQRLDQLVAFVYDDVSEELHALAARSLSAGLEKLEAEGRIQSSRAGWMLSEGS